MTVTVFNKGTKELIATISDTDIILKDGYDVIVENGDKPEGTPDKKWALTVDEVIHELAKQICGI